MKTVTEHLLALADAGNAAFTARLAPGVEAGRKGCVATFRSCADSHARCAEPPKRPHS